jgi:hypothetical protein
MSEICGVLDVEQPNFIPYQRKKYKGREDEEEDISSYWMTLRKWNKIIN